jgi:hypothetical protein
LCIRSRDISVSIVARLRAGRPGFDSRQGQEYLFATVSREALRPTHPAVQWIPGALSSGVKRPGREADHLSQSNAGFRMRGGVPLYTQYVFMLWYLIKYRMISLFISYRLC